MCLPQRRKGAKKTFRNAAALCAAAPLREKSSSSRYFSCKAPLTVVPIDRVSHRHQNLSRTGVWCAPVCCEHVVQQHHVARLVRERDQFLPVSFAELLQHFRLNPRTITVVSVR